jgi:phosphoribosylamine--glycine ligase
MKILVVGSGGREHALVWKLLQSPRAEKVFCAPGNAGIASIATCVAINADDVEGLLRFAQAEGIGLTVVGPEAALSLGIVDRFEAAGLRIFGPNGRAAELEGSKVFMKELLKKYGVPSGGFEVFTDAEAARRYIEQQGAPLVVKADGLAAGKGVIVATTTEEALAAVDLIMGDKAFGEAGNRIVVEEFLAGEEASFIAFTDGDTVLPLPTSQDHKAVYDGDKGPNTGGMGAYSPAPVVTAPLHQRVMDEIMLPTVRAMAAEGRPFKGMLYAGLMIQGERLSVLEYNCRFGDPECQPLLMRLRTDLVDILEAVVDRRLAAIDLAVDPRPTVCVVMAAGGYPGPYEKGKVIHGLADAADLPETMVFHAGTAAKNGEIVTNGGRVLGVTALGDTLQQAIDRAYVAVDRISWEGCYCRRDIGYKALRLA